jgi:hypothetical protein
MPLVHLLVSDHPDAASTSNRPTLCGLWRLPEEAVDDVSRVTCPVCRDLEAEDAAALDAELDARGPGDLAERVARLELVVVEQARESVALRQLIAQQRADVIEVLDRLDRSLERGIRR